MSPPTKEEFFHFKRWMEERIPWYIFYYYLVFGSHIFFVEL